MALSFEQYLGDGLTVTFAVPFPYLDKSHVVVQVDGIDVTFTWDDDSTVRLSSAPANNAVVDVRRKTPNTDRLVDFNDGSVLTEKDLDLSNLQTFYIVQEAIDIAGGTLGIEADGSYTANFRRIANVGNAVNAGDAINKGYHDGTFIPEMNTIKTDTIAAKDAAVTAKNDAVTAKDTAVSSKNAAATSEERAGLWENNAYKFAEEAKDVSFTTNISNGGPFYSAKHYSLKADDARAAAVTAKNAAQTAESNAATSATNASNSASSASTSATNASNSASAAATSETNAATSETNAGNSENKAFDWANSLASMTHPDYGSTTFYSAVVWATANGVPDGSAKEWATKAPGTTIGTTGEYSAKHYADQAALYAAGLSLPAIDGADGGKMLRVKDDTTGYQLVTPAATRTHIGAEPLRHIARMEKTGLESLANVTWTKLSWQRNVIDTLGGVVDLANNRLVMPSGVKYVSIIASVTFDGNNSGQRAGRIQKNGFDIAFNQWVPMYNSGNQIVSGWHPTIAGDVYTVDFLQSSGAALNVQDGISTFLQVEMIF